MVTPAKPTPSNEPGYRIGAVCRLTGLSPHVLRVWEKRYHAVDPERSDTGRRHYREQDIHRLQLLKALVDRGQAIGSIANLDNRELENRLQQSSAMRTSDGMVERPGLATFGITLGENGDDYSGSNIFDLLGHFERISDYETSKPTLRLDVAVIEWPSVHPETSVEITQLANRLNARHVVLVYDYAPRALLKRLGNDRITALRSPLDMAALEAVIAWRFGRVVAPGNDMESAAGSIPSREYNDRELAYLAAQSSTIACECPMHLAQLITRLVHFEAYSAECESRNDQDAALHSYLHKTTSTARNLMERALTRVVELENLKPPPDL